MRTRCSTQLLLSTMLALFGGGSLQAQTSGASAVVLTVTDAKTAAPVLRATVMVKGVRGSWVTDSAGVARVGGLPEGAHALKIEAPGYATEDVPVELAGSAPVAMDVALTPSPVPLKALEVAGKREAVDPFLLSEGFYDRARVGGGTFIAGERLQKLQAKTWQLVDAMRGVGGFNVVPNKSGYGFAVLSTRGIVSINLPCYPAVFMDGLRVPYPSKLMESFNDILPLAAAGGIEIYPGAQFTPIQYGRHPCGTILIWTKHGPASK